MYKIVKNIAVGILVSLSLLAFSPLLAQSAESKPSKEKNSKYTNLFKGKRVETAKGKFITLHKMDSKVYFELPLKYLGREMLLGATISAVSVPDYLTVGMKGHDPVHLRFEKVDSAIVAKVPNVAVFRNNADKQLSEALDLNYRDASLASFRIEAYTPDSSAVVIDATSLVGRPNNMVPAIPKTSGSFTLTATPQSNFTVIKSLKAFDNNVSVKVECNYLLTVSIMRIYNLMTDMPSAVDVTYSLMLLPEEKMVPRIADARVGVFTTTKQDYATGVDKSRLLHLAHRWRMEPANEKAFAAGELVEPKKPIVFYIDNTFPEGWKQPIREGVLKWNAAFEKIGFRNALQVRDFPVGDPSFDPDNLTYSCIRYVPNTQENAVGPAWIDPTTGEIINASVIVFNNVEQLLHKWRFVQTANIDPTIRTDKLPTHLFNEGLSYVIAHEVGHTLGLKHNFAASSAYSTEHLRSAEFTRKNGITPSIMDYARYNYVAQPQDKGVYLSNDKLGAYDLYAIDWNYRYFPHLGKDVWAEAKALEAMADKRAGDPVYRYVPEPVGGLYDPTVVSEDLGNDPIRSGNYGIKNLNEIQKNLALWITNDPDSRKKNTLQLAIAQQYHRLWKNVLNQVGGIVVNNSKESSGIPRYRVLPKQMQRDAMLWSIRQTKQFTGYANRALERKGFMSISYYDQLLEFLMMDLLNVRARVIVASHLSPDSYSLKDYFDDMYAQLFKSTIEGKSTTHTERLMQRAFVEAARNSITSSSPSAPSVPTALAGASPTDKYFEAMNLLGYVPMELKKQLQTSSFGLPTQGLYPTFDLKALDKSNVYFFEIVQKLKPLLERRIASTSDIEQKAHYQVLLFRLKRDLGEKE